MRRTSVVTPLITSLFVLCVIFHGCATKPQKPQELFNNPTVDQVSEGILFFQNGEYHRAIEVFKDVIARRPGSSLLSESQWMLARSYEAAGMWKEAVTEYTFYLQNYPRSGHAPEARARLEALRREARSSTRIVGLRSLPTGGPGGLSPGRIEAYRRRGINTLVVPLHDARGVLFKTDRAPTTSDHLDRIVQLAHASDMMVFGEVSPGEMTWISLAHPELADLVYRPGVKKLVRSKRPDLFNGGVWRDLSELLRDALRSGVDGFLLKVSVGPNEGWSASTESDFERAFGQRITPAVLSRGKSGEYPSIFWHWIGWRARRLTQWVGETKAALTEAKWGVVLTEDAVSSPRDGLVDSAQDLVALRGLGFDYYVISAARPADAKMLEPRIEILLPEVHQRILSVPSPTIDSAASRLAAWGGVIANVSPANTP
ncbi:MAG TPA: tetratricopeptide repeat protein [Nitrospiria bacterium]|nr:tetratricopeptide repeat protein [Nitrospiria bacterium]